jgi:UDP-glucose 4-epimerase
MPSNLEGASIFITGGAGFIGSHIAARCIDRSQVTLYDDFTRNALGGRLDMDHQNLRVVKGDVLDSPALGQAMKGHDVVFHCAAVAGLASVDGSQMRTLRVNVLGSASVLETASQLGSISRVICFSTSEVFGSSVNASESSNAVIPTTGEPRWSYAVSKLAEEHLAMAYHREAALPVSIIRPFNIYGPGQVGEGAIADFIRRALAEEPLVINGTGAQLRAWCFIDDMVDGVLLAAVGEGAVGESFNIGNPWAVETTLGLARRVLEHTGSPSEIRFQDARADIAARTPDITKASTVLGFSPKVDLDEGIKRTVEGFRGVQA